MKKFARYLIPLLFISLVNKGYSQCDRCTTLMQQVKEDKLFLSFLAVNESIVNVYAENAKNAPRSENMREQDSIYMRDSTVSIEQKFEAMNYKGLKVIRELSLQASEMLAKLEDRYPLLKELTDDEHKVFIKMSIEYYNALKKQ